MAVWLVAIVALGALLVERQSAARLRKELFALRASNVSEMPLLKQRTSAYEGLMGHVALGDGVGLSGTDHNGDSTSFYPRHAVGRTLLYSIVPTCPSCWQAVPFLNALDASGSCDVRVLAIAVGDTPSFVRADSGRTRFDVLFNASGALWEALPIAVPSSAVLIGEHGRLEALWPGGPSGLPTAEILGILGPKCAVT